MGVVSALYVHLISALIGSVSVASEDFGRGYAVEARRSWKIRRPKRLEIDDPAQRLERITRLRKPPKVITNREKPRYVHRAPHLPRPSESLRVAKRQRFFGASTSIPAEKVRRRDGGHPMALIVLSDHPGAI